ncbi:Protein CBG15951 [Caenorhabditis briggsae]|uniref:Protein CBG15951 n=1 Tax=Caenorhabditis briggsae TaxID=6238 RepID=A8XNE5_CAEBR|nr:Protein CBG15951 [Caenorhabditis briggsae]CAP34376.1 Protein CBG15951 [Caenorhabditis briggsae]
MAPRKNKPIVQVQGYAMRFKKMNKNGTELFYCVERERRARCDAAYHFDRMNNTLTVKNQHARHDEDFVRSEPICQFPKDTFSTFSVQKQEQLGVLQESENDENVEGC